MNYSSRTSPRYGIGRRSSSGLGHSHRSLAVSRSFSLQPTFDFRDRRTDDVFNDEVDFDVNEFAFNQSNYEEESRPTRGGTGDNGGADFGNFLVNEMKRRISGSQLEEISAIRSMTMMHQENIVGSVPPYMRSRSRPGRIQEGATVPVANLNRSGRVSVTMGKAVDSCRPLDEYEMMYGRKSSSTSETRTSTSDLYRSSSFGVQPEKLVSAGFQLGSALPTGAQTGGDVGNFLKSSMEMPTTLQESFFQGNTVTQPSLSLKSPTSPKYGRGIFTEDRKQNEFHSILSEKPLSPNTSSSTKIDILNNNSGNINSPSDSKLSFSSPYERTIFHTPTKSRQSSEQISDQEATPSRVSTGASGSFAYSNSVTNDAQSRFTSTPTKVLTIGIGDDRGETPSSMLPSPASSVSSVSIDPYMSSNKRDVVSAQETVTKELKETPAEMLETLKDVKADNEERKEGDVSKNILSTNSTTATSTSKIEPATNSFEDATGNCKSTLKQKLYSSPSMESAAAALQEALTSASLASESLREFVNESSSEAEIESRSKEVSSEVKIDFEGEKDEEDNKIKSLRELVSDSLSSKKQDGEPKDGELLIEEDKKINMDFHKIENESSRFRERNEFLSKETNFGTRLVGETDHEFAFNSISDSSLQSDHNNIPETFSGFNPPTNFSHEEEIFNPVIMSPDLSHLITDFSHSSITSAADPPPNNSLRDFSLSRSFHDPEPFSRYPASTRFPSTASSTNFDAEESPFARRFNPNLLESNVDAVGIDEKFRRDLEDSISSMMSKKNPRRTTREEEVKTAESYLHQRVFKRDENTDQIDNILQQLKSTRKFHSKKEEDEPVLFKPVSKEEEMMKTIHKIAHDVDNLAHGIAVPDQNPKPRHRGPRPPPKAPKTIEDIGDRKGWKKHLLTDVEQELERFREEESYEARYKKVEEVQLTQKQQRELDMGLSLEEFYYTGRMNPELSRSVLEVDHDFLASTMSEEEANFILQNFSFEEMAGQLQEKRDAERRAAQEIERRVSGSGLGAPSSTPQRRNAAKEGLRNSVRAEMSRGMDIISGKRF